MIPTPAVLFRIYPDPKTGKTLKMQQGKITTAGPGGIAIYYRDVSNRHRFWEQNAWMLDWMVFEVCCRAGVKEFHLFDPIKQILFVLPWRAIRDKVINYPWQYVVTRGGHTQIALPYALWEKRKKDYSLSWVEKEITVNDFISMEDRLRWAAIKKKSAEYWEEARPSKADSAIKTGPVPEEKMISVPEKYRGKSWEEIGRLLGFKGGKDKCGPERNG